MKMALRIVKYLAVVAYGVAGVILILFLWPQTGWKALSVKTGSMTPAIPTGSLVVVHREPLQLLRVGDVITYIDPANPKITITHRIVKAEAKRGLPYFVTKGDANQAADPEIIGGAVVGKVVWHAPWLGRVTGAVRSLPGVIILVVIPGLIIIQEEIRRLRRTWWLEEAPAPRVSPAVSQDTKPAVTVPSHRSMDGVRHLMILVLAGGMVLLGGRYTFSLWQARATLADNTFSIPVSPTPTPSSTCTNITNVTNLNFQTATSGNVTSTGNAGNGQTGGGQATNTERTATIVASGC